jgi:hypothetical protein
MMEITAGQPTTSPIACTLTSAEHAQRQQAVRDLFRSVDAVQELPDGYAFRFPGDDHSFAALAEFIAVERRCCPFFTFTLLVAPDGGPLWLHLRGSMEIKTFVGKTFMTLMVIQPAPMNGIYP